MDFDTLDATQAIYHEEFDDETDEDLSPSQRKPVAYLHVHEQKGLQNKEYPVYEGDNIIGRHESCHICIPSKSLSKEHACITVKSGSHLIYDKGSRNKTKRGKLFLSPDVRYELKDKNELLFADVNCMYVMVTQKEVGKETGSETEEEKMETSSQSESTPSKDKNSDNQAGVVLCAQSDEEDDASDASFDILLPTQPYDSTSNNTVGLQKAGARTKAGGTGESDMSSVMETPDFLKKPLDVSATLVLPESGSETEDEGMNDLPPERLIFPDDNDRTEDESAIQGAATQAIGGRPSLVDETQMYKSDDDDHMSGSDVDMEAATQVIRRPSPKGKGKSSKKTHQKAGGSREKYITVEKTQAYEMDIGRTGKNIPVDKTQAYEMDIGSTRKGIHVEKTQAYEMDISSDSNSKDIGKKAKNVALFAMETQKIDVADDDDDKIESPKSSKKVKITALETQKIDDVVDSDSDSTETKDPKSAKKMKITTMETQKMEDVADDEDEREDSKASKNKALTMIETQKMDAGVEESEEENEEEKNEEEDPHLTGLFSMSTLACEVSDEEESDDNGKGAESHVNFDDSTQAIGDTLAFEDEEQEAIPKKGRGTKKAAATEDATAPLEDATMPIESKGDVDAKEEDATMPVDANDSTMPISAGDATMPVSANDATMPVNTGDATVAIEDSPEDDTMPVDDKTNATMPLDDKNEDATMPIDEKSDDATLAIDDPTMPIDEEVATVPISDTVPVSDTVAISDTVSVPDTVPISDTVPLQDPTPAKKRKAKRSAAHTADTLPVTDVINDGTQEFGKGAVSEDEVATLPISDETSGEESATSSGVRATVGDTVPIDDDESLPIFLPQITRGSDVSDDESTPEMVPESQHDEESTSIIKIPQKSPLKPTLVIHNARNRSPSPKRVAFAELEDSDEEPPPQTPSSRGRKKGSKPETTPSAQRKRRGCGTKTPQTVDTNQDETSQESAEAGPKSSNAGGESDASKDSAEVGPVSSKQNTPSVKGKAGHFKQDVKSTAAKDQTATPEPRRSGRARKSKKFADDSGEEEEEAQKEQEEDGKAADTPAPQAKKRTRGKASTRGNDVDLEAKGESKGPSVEDENAGKEIMSSAAASDSVAEVKPGPSEPNTTEKDTHAAQTSPSITEEEAFTVVEDKKSGREKKAAKASSKSKTPETCEEHDADSTEPMDVGETETKVEDDSVTTRKTGRRGRTIAQKRKGSPGSDDRAANKKVKLSSDAGVDHSENKSEDTMEIEVEETTSGKEEQSAKGRRASRKGSKPEVDSDQVQETEAEISGQSSSRSRGRASRKSAAAETITPAASTSTAGKETISKESEDKSDGVRKGRKGARGARSAARSGEEAVTESEESQELSVTSEKTKKTVAEEELVDTEDTPFVTDVAQENNESVGRRGRGRQTKKSRKENSETEKEIAAKQNAPKTQPRGRRSRAGSAEDTDSQESSDKVTQDSDNAIKRSRTARGKSGDVAKQADTSCTGEASNHQDPDTDDSSAALSSKKRTNKPQTESVGEELGENSQGTVGRRRGRQGQKTPSSETHEAAEKEPEEETHTSASRRGRSKQKDQEPEKEEITEPIAKPGRKTRTSQSTDRDTVMEPEAAETMDGPTVAKQGRQAKKPKEVASAEPSVMPRGQTKRALRSEIDASEDSQSEGGSHRLSTRRGQQLKNESAEKGETVEATAEESNLVSTHSRRGRQAKDQPDPKAEQDNQDPTPARMSRQTKRTQDKKTEVLEHKQEGATEDVTPAKRGRQAKKTQSTEKDVSTDGQPGSSRQSHNQGTQESAASGPGRKGRGKSDNTGSESFKPDSVDTTDKGSTRRGAKHIAAQMEAGSSDVPDSETAESGEGPTPQKQGRKAKKPAKDAGTENETSPAPARPGRHSSQSGNVTPKRAGQKSEAEIMHSPLLRRSTLGTKPKVIFTGVTDEHGQKIVKELGGELAQSIQECTHLVTDKIRRTVKFLGGVARGMNIVTPQWLESSKSSGMFVDSSRFTVQDTAAEKQYKFSLESSLHKASQSLLLEGYHIHVTKSVRPEPQQMKEIVQCAGGDWLVHMPKKAAPKILVISCEEDRNACQAALNAGVDVVSAEFILTGILRQEVDIDAFRLFGSPSGTTSSRKRR